MIRIINQAMPLTVSNVYQLEVAIKIVMIHSIIIILWVFWNLLVLVVEKDVLVYFLPLHVLNFQEYTVGLFIFILCKLFITFQLIFLHLQMKLE